MSAALNLDKLLMIGAQMANVMYNLAQRPGEPLTADHVATMDSLRKQWDAARRTAPAVGADGLPALPESRDWMLLAEFNERMPPGSLSEIGHKNILLALRAVAQAAIAADRQAQQYEKGQK